MSEAARDVNSSTLAGPQRASQGSSLPATKPHLETIQPAREQHPARAAANVETLENLGPQSGIATSVLPDLGTDHAQEDSTSLVQDWKQQSVSRWSSIFDKLYHREPPNQDPTLNSVGWVDTATGAPFSAREMHQWLSDAVRGILALEPRRVVEIGCGTGMILYRIAPHCEHFHATDISHQALDQLARRRGLGSSQGGLPPNVTLEQAAAEEVSLRSGSFDVAVINSAIQYFPSIQYLLSVLRGLAESLPDGGAIYLGDVRSRPLLETFYTEVQLTQADDDESLELVAERVRRQRQCESELAIDPAFFRALPQVLSRVSQVEILPKRGRGTSEAFRYRYQVVLRIGESSAVPYRQPTHPSWLGWQDAGLSLDLLGRQLTDEAPTTLALAAVPNARNDRSRAISALMKGAAEIRTAGDVRRRLGVPCNQDLGVEPEDLWCLAGELGYAMEWSWARHDAEGHFDVYLRRGDLAGEAHDLRWPESPPALASTKPLYGE